MNQLKTITDLDKVREMITNPHCEACDHVRENSELAVAIFTEKDSFGPLCWYAVCEECYQKTVKDEDAEVCACHQCKTVMTRGKLYAWKWYDFYAEQGDEPMLLCSTCRNSEQHKERVAEDRRHRKKELGY